MRVPDCYHVVRRITISFTSQRRSRYAPFMKQFTFIERRASPIDSLGILVSDRYRTIPEARVIDILLLAGWAFELELGGCVEAITQTRSALERWIDLGLGFQRDGDGRRYFDPVEVVNFLIWTGRLGLDRFWADHYVNTGRALVVEHAQTDLTKQLHLTLQRRFDLQQFEPGDRVRLRLPVPLDCAYVTDLTMSPVVAPSLSAMVSFDAGRMEVRLKTPATQAVEIGVNLNCTAAPACSNLKQLTPAEEEIYRRPAEGIIRVSSRIQDLADALAGTIDKPWDILRSFWAYMMDHLWCGAIHYDQVPAEEACDWVLNHKWYDCQLGSALFVSLCRARGIPARMVSGNVLYRLAPTNHFWAEAWIDGYGWAPFDFASWGLSLGGVDAAWREHFFGKTDFRLVTQILPLTFTGPMSTRFPPAWHMVQTGVPGGVSIEFLELDGRLIYEDSVLLR